MVHHSKNVKDTNTEKQERTKTLNTILLVDDDTDTNMIVSYIINKNHLAEKIEIALNGEEAISYLENNPPPSLILLDINMPRMNGWEFLEEYNRFDSKIKHTAVVVMVTVSLNPDDRERARKFNVTLINKPMTEDVLKQVIMNC